MNSEQRMAERIARATAEGIERAQRAPALAAARQQMNESLRQAHANGAPKVTTDTTREGRLRHALDQREEAARTGQGLDQGARGGQRPDPTPGQTVNDRMRDQLGIEH
jgi:hypothetical protein